MTDRFDRGASKAHQPTVSRPVSGKGIGWLLLAVCLSLWPTAVLSGPEPSAEPGQTWDFDTLPPGPIPNAFQVGTFYDGRPAGEWKIIITDRAKSQGQVLAPVQAKGSDQTHKLLLFEGSNSGDIDVEVSYLAVSGKAADGGGLVWRASDDKNYYLLRAGAIDHKVRLYRMVKGVPQPIKGIDRNIQAGGWHTIRVVQKGCEIQAFFDGESMFRLCDSGLTTGRIGLWTNADAVTYFDDLRLRRLH